MNPKLKSAIICLRISSIFYFILGIGLILLLLLFSKQMFGQYQRAEQIGGFIAALFCALLSLGMGIFVEIVIAGLKKTKYWSWIAAIVLTATYIPSLFIILGIIGIIGLLDRSVISSFQQARSLKINSL